LTKEINKAAKAAMTGKAFHEAFQVIGSKVESNIVKRSIALIVEGVKAGGTLTDLLDDTSSDIRKFEQLKKEVDSNVSIYKIFLFAACAIGAPLLYATATFLIQIVFGIRSNMDFSAAEAASMGLPILKGTAISPDLVFWFSLVAITFTTLFSSLAVGIITAGREGEGIKYFPVLFGVAIIVFLGTGAGLKLVYSLLFMPTG
jgi:flagellar protein FlaJ